MRKPSCSIFFCAIFLAQFFSMSRKWFGVWETISLGFSHTFGFLPPEPECNFTPVSHSLLPLFPTFFLVWCYLPRVTVREWGRWCRQTPSCWNTQQIAASEGLLCYNDLLYQAGRDTGWENSPELSSIPSRLCAWQVELTYLDLCKQSIYAHLPFANKTNVLYNFISTRLLFIPLWRSGQGREPLTSFYHPHLGASGALYRLPCQDQTAGLWWNETWGWLECHSQLLSSPFSRPKATGSLRRQAETHRVRRNIPGMAVSASQR